MVPESSPTERSRPPRHAAAVHACEGIIVIRRSVIAGMLRLRYWVGIAASRERASNEVLEPGSAMLVDRI